MRRLRPHITKVSTPAVVATAAPLAPPPSISTPPTANPIPTTAPPIRRRLAILEGLASWDLPLFAVSMTDYASSPLSCKADEQRDDFGRGECWIVNPSD